MDPPIQDALDQPGTTEPNADEIASLFHAVQHEQTDLVSQLLAKDNDLIAARQQDGRTALHLAAEEGLTDMVRTLFKHGADTEAAATDGDRPLFIAAKNGDAKMVDLLAKGGASVESRNDVLQTTALLLACQLGHVEVARLLIDLDADIEARLSDGRTPLVMAVASGKTELVRLLLQHGANKLALTEDGRSLEDLEGHDARVYQLLQNDYLLQGPETTYSKVEPVQPTRFVRRPKPPLQSDKASACRAFDANIIQFFIGDREQRSQPVTVPVHDVLYGRGPDSIVKDSLKHMQLETGPSFTWIHLPANNMKWVEDLIIRLLADRKPNADAPDKAFKSDLGLSHAAWRRGRSRKWKSPSFLRPHCQFVEKNSNFSWRDVDVGQIVAVIPFLHFEYYEDFKVMTQHLKSAKAAKSRTAAPEIPPAVVSPPNAAPQPPPPGNPPPESDMVGEEKPRSPANAAGRLSVAQEHQAVDLEHGLAAPGSEVKQEKNKSRPIQDWIRAAISAKATAPRLETPKAYTEQENPHVSLIRGYASGRTTQKSLQPRRTLDQYFYSDLENTSQRDSDQVVYRYTLPNRPKLIMVDQLWLWILNGDTIISCSPLRWSSISSESSSGPPGTSDSLTRTERVAQMLDRGPSLDLVRSKLQQQLASIVSPTEWSKLPGVVPEGVAAAPESGDAFPEGRGNPRVSLNPRPHVRAHDPLNLLQSVLEHLKQPARKPITSVHDLAGLITNCCANLFDEHRVSEDFQFFDFFEFSVNDIIDKATHQLHEFRKSVKSYKFASDLILATTRNELDDAQAEMDKKMSIVVEIGMLVELEDIRDELHSLKVVLTDQSKTMKHLGDPIRAASSSILSSGAAAAVSEPPTMDMHCNVSHLSRIHGMEQLTDTARKSLYQLVDLKQKYASFIAARRQAETAAENLKFQEMVETSNAQQGKSLMVFTVVTIVFLPLSFMAAFFSIDIDVFPVNVDDKLQLGYVLKYMLGVGFGAAIPFVLLAFRLDDLSRAWKAIVRKLHARTIFFPLTVLLLVVVTAAIWTSKLAPNIKVTVIIVMSVLVLVSAAFGISYLKTRRLQYTYEDTMSATSGSSGSTGSSSRIVD